MQEADHRVQGGRDAMQRIISGGQMPTAIMASNDLTAIGAMGALLENGLRVPEDGSGIGFDDIELSAYTWPALTTVHVPRRELAATAFRSLYQGGDSQPEKRLVVPSTMIGTRLIARQSTAKAPLGRR